MGCIMETVIRKWGNSPALRLPAAIMKEAGYQLDQKVEVILSNGRIIIQPMEKVEYDLDEMIRNMDDDNRHEETSFGGPVGKELL